jgi:hypothetical protein
MTHCWTTTAAAAAAAAAVKDTFMCMPLTIKSCHRKRPTNTLCYLSHSTRTTTYAYIHITIHALTCISVTYGLYIDNPVTLSTAGTVRTTITVAAGSSILTAAAAAEVQGSNSSDCQ